MKNPAEPLKLAHPNLSISSLAKMSCSDRYGASFLDSTPPQQKEVLDLIAFRKNAASDPSLSQGLAFFARLRQMTCDGFYTSKIGIEDLQYIGNTALASFPGCPPFPES